MLKLYKRDKGKVTAYHEAWINGSKIVEHWGQLSRKGKTREHRCQKKLSQQENIERVLASVMSEGFEPIGNDGHSLLLIEYKIEGWGNAEDLTKRHALQDRMDETLGWTGLGHCDGGSIGSGTMDVYCFVVDFDIAKGVIEKDLRRRGGWFGRLARYEKPQEGHREEQDTNCCTLVPPIGINLKGEESIEPKRKYEQDPDNENGAGDT